ncbi:MAG: hypothetical protein AB2693_15670 [Candidatus Thiodiazotropha sp.]
MSQLQQYTSIEASYQVSQGQSLEGVAPPYSQVSLGHPHLGFAPSVFQGHPQGGFAPHAFQQTQTSTLSIKADWLPRSLYFDQFDSWTDFYRRFDNYAKDKH